MLKTNNMTAVQNSEVTANNFDEGIICIYWQNIHKPSWRIMCFKPTSTTS